MPNGFVELCRTKSRNYAERIFKNMPIWVVKRKKICYNGRRNEKGGQVREENCR